MPIDWFTVAAQTLNFLILIWLLRHFLYQPILRGLDTREQKIKDILAQANNTQSQAEALRTEFEQKMTDIEQQRELILKIAQQEASKEHQLAVEGAQQVADQLLRKRMDNLQYELQNLHQEIVHKNIQEVHALARKTLGDLAGLPIEQAMLERLLKRTQELEQGQLNELISALSRTDNEVAVRSAFVLSDEQKSQIQQTLRARLSPGFDKPMSLTFTLSPELIIGIEITISGWKLPWSVNNYLQTLQHKVTALSKIVPAPASVRDLSLNGDNDHHRGKLNKENTP